MTIQEIRTRQALTEQGRNESFTFDHSTPWVEVSGKRYTLVFPRSLFLPIDFDRPIESLFIGKMTPSRETFLKKCAPCTIVPSMRGRDEQTKANDTSYWEAMRMAKFAPCPNGDFTWTYRFFEACICGAIPIIEDFAECYSGFKFYRADETPVYREDWVKHNRMKVEREMTLDKVK